MQAQKGRKKVLVLISFAVLFLPICGILLSEAMVHLPHIPLHPAKSTTIGVLRLPHEDAEIQSADGLALRGWYFPSPDSQRAVILVHGQGANREQMIPFVYLFLKHNYNVLMPDMRGHGISDGHEITYGLKEREDITLWLNWMEAKGELQSLLGFGESMGAAILLQSLEKEKRFTGIIAEGSYADFHEVAYDRIESSMGVRSEMSSFALSPLVESGFLWERLLHGIDLRDASPLKSLAANRTPILLIHSNTDSIVPLHHSIELARQNPEFVQLWQVENARHTGAYSLNRALFETHVFQWIDQLSGMKNGATDN